MPSGHQIAGKGSRISANGTILNYGKYECGCDAEKIGTENFESGGKNQSMTGFQGLKWSFGGQYDAAANPFDSPPALYPQDTYPNLYFYLNAVTNLFWSQPLAIILSSKAGSEAKGAVSFDASGESNGPFSFPTGSF